MISLTLIILQVQSLLHLLIFPSVIHHCSDHFPIVIEQNNFSTEDHNLKWKLNRANWDLFNTLCTGKWVPENFKESSDPMADFTSMLIEIYKECIPQTSTNPT